MTMLPIADFRSDTVTRPTPAMLEAMFSAKVGDDVFEDDPTVNQLEEKAAVLFGKEAALFCASGTMTNQIAIKIHTQPGDEVICDKNSHIYAFEGGGIAFNSGSSVRLLDGDRLFNALVKKDETTLQYGRIFDTISICLSKGLGAPVGSLLLGTKAMIKKARRIRKVMGGGWRQAGYLAAAGIYALDHQISRLKEDHARTEKLYEALSGLNFVDEILPVETNILIFKLKDHIFLPSFQQHLEKQNILISAMGRQSVRLVTHLDINDEMVERTIEAFKTVESKS
jgi:threonine aldolase